MKKDEDCFVVEGIRAVGSILESTLSIRALIRFRDSDAKGLSRLEELARRRGVEIRHVDERNARKYVSTKTPQGIAALVEKPPAPDIALLAKDARRILVLDGVSDPGNVGTLVRTAWLLGWDACVATPGSALFFGEKVVRASAGAIGFIPVAVAPAQELRKLLQREGFRILLAVPGGDTDRDEGNGRLALVLGGEAHGPLSSWPEARSIGIPIRKSPVDSLGVVAGGAILLDRFR